MKLLNAVLLLGRSKLVVWVSDPPHNRKISINWFAKERTDMPPVDWVKQVEEEVSYQHSVDKAGVPFDS
jgi:hypothetical protein